MRITFNSLVGFSLPEQEKLERARKILETILSSADYRQAVLNADFSGETSEWASKSNKEILEHILSGREVLLPIIDNEVDISLTIFTPRFYQRGTVGYTYPNAVMQWISRKFFWALSDAEVAGNLIHEWLHKMGFDHDFRPTLRRKHSVCYKHNEIIKNLASQLGLLNPTHAKLPINYSRPNVLARAYRWLRSFIWLEPPAHK